MAQDNIIGLQVAEKMGELEAEISVPIISKEKLIGILNLGHKEGKEIYSSEDLELLSTLANQAAIAIRKRADFMKILSSPRILSAGRTGFLPWDYLPPDSRTKFAIP